MYHLVRPSRIISNQMSMKRQMLSKCLLFHRSCTPIFLLFGLRGSHQTSFQTAGSRAGVPPLASFWHRGDNRSVCALKLCVVTHVRSSATLSRRSFRSVTRGEGRQRERSGVPDVSHMRELQFVFHRESGSVGRTWGRACVYTANRERERIKRESSQKANLCGGGAGSQSELNTPIASVFPGQWEQTTEKERHSSACCPVLSCHLSSAQGQLCHFRTTWLFISSLECAGSCPSSPFAASTTFFPI